jgi:ribosome-binding factor A
MDENKQTTKGDKQTAFENALKQKEEDFNNIFKREIPETPDFSFKDDTVYTDVHDINQIIKQRNDDITNYNFNNDGNDGNGGNGDKLNTTDNIQMNITEIVNEPQPQENQNNSIEMIIGEKNVNNNNISTIKHDVTNDVSNAAIYNKLNDLTTIIMDLKTEVIELKKIVISNNIISFN